MGYVIGSGCIRVRKGVLAQERKGICAVIGSASPSGCIRERKGVLAQERKGVCARDGGDRSAKPPGPGHLKKTKGNRRAGRKNHEV